MPQAKIIIAADANATVEPEKRVIRSAKRPKKELVSTLWIACMAGKWGFGKQKPHWPPEYHNITP